VYVAGRGLILSDELPKSCSWFVLVKLESLERAVSAAESGNRFPGFVLLHSDYETMKFFKSISRKTERTKAKRRKVR
jgi:hypothetical protein